MQQYCNIVFIQERDEMVDKFLSGEIDSISIVNYLGQWDNGPESEHDLSLSKEEPWGSTDYVERVEEYILTYNTRLWYAGLVRMVKIED